jgi:hypothetical protein
MVTLSLTQLAVMFLLLLAVFVLGWVYVAGDTEGDMVDERPTLDVQNHEGDETWTS